ncbi:hypothetical protein NC653_037003 [Populus alba x Populus x berolinensis]|uniref:Uncharacterized protein n=1 Tax=Populus alba x Populus x berolinensis TaxID=444605 RepID=A0AAD6PVJ2_9ROSI|nr:hypothetical protein NC653_037003 [Populus alba x Populus x berolinensis]
MGCEKQDVPRATLTGFRNLAVITMRRLEKMILRKEEELHQKVPNDCVAYDISDTEDSVAELKSFSALQGIEPVPATTHNKRKLFNRNHDQDLIKEACPSQVQQPTYSLSIFCHACKGLGR